MTKEKAKLRSMATAIRGEGGRFLVGPFTGRAAGARKRAARFLDDLHADWKRNGRATIDRLRRLNPLRYLLIVAAIPRRPGNKRRASRVIDDQP